MRVIAGFILAAVVLAGNPGQAQEIALTDPEVVKIRQNVLLPYFEALKGGDVAALGRYISLDLYERNRVLFEENLEYPAFLRNYYKDISFKVVDAESCSSGAGILFHVSFDYATGYSSVHELKLGKEKHGTLQDDVWVVEDF
jgi:hypothetical protein